jgi:hypothetical protein
LKRLTRRDLALPGFAMGGAAPMIEEQTPATRSDLSIPPIASLSTPRFARQHCLVADRTFMPFLLVPTFGADAIDRLGGHDGWDRTLR